VEDKIMNTKYSSQKHQSASETEEMYDECYSCFMCIVSFNSQFALDAHLQTHIDDDTFHHSNINRITEPLPQSSIKPPKYFRTYNEHMLNLTGEKLHYGEVCDRKYHNIANFRTHLKSDNNVRTLTCSLNGKTMVCEKNYYIHTIYKLLYGCTY